jgi:hypothetical protein
MDTEQRLDRLELFAEEVKHRLARIEGRLDVIEALMKHMATKEDIGNLRAEMAQMETRILRWFVATAFAMTSVMAAVAIAAIKFIH